MAPISAKNNSRVVATPVRSPKLSPGTAQDSKYPMRSPLLGADSLPSLLSPTAQERMLSVLESVGCPLHGDIFNPLFKDEKIAVFIMQSYVDLYGFFPSSRQLDGQGFSVLRSVMRAHGGQSAMKRLLVNGKKSASFPAPKKKNKKSTSKPTIPSPKPEAKAKSSKPKPKPEPADVPAQETVSVYMEPVNEGLNDFVCLEDELSPRESRLVMHFLNSIFETRMGRNKEGEACLSLSKSGLKIPIEAMGRKLFFRKKDIAALPLLMALEGDSLQLASAALEDLCREVYAAKVHGLPKLGSRLWAAREFWTDNSEGRNFPERTRDKFMHILKLPKVVGFLKESYSDYFREENSSALRRHSSLQNNAHI